MKLFDLKGSKTVFLYSMHVKSTIFDEIGGILLHIYRILSYYKRRWLKEMEGERERAKIARRGGRIKKLGRRQATRVQV
jgi:hypothetical protein